MSKMPWFPFYPSDFLGAEKVQLMTNEQVGMYIKLLCYQWMEGSIPEKSSSAIAVLRLGHGTTSEMTDFQNVLESCFVKHPSEKGRLINKRLDAIRCEQEAISLKKQAAGRAGGYAKARLAVLGFCQDSATSKSLAKPGYSNPNSNTNSKRREEEESAQPRKRSASMSDAEFLESLKTNPAYQHIDITEQLSKMDAWLLVHPGRQKTRKFIVGWLNKIEKPLPINGTAHAHAAIPPFPPANDPIARGLWRKAYGNPQTTRTA